MITSDQAVYDLLLATLQRFVADDAQIVASTSIPLQGGMSGSAVSRHTIQCMTALGTATTSLITKDADRHEWRVLQHLQSQQQPNIPFAHTIDTVHGKRLQICLQDVGDVWNQLLLGMLIGIICAPTYYVAFEWPRYAGRPLLEIINPQGGGIAIHGAIIGALLAVLLYTRRHHLPLLTWLDICAPTVLVGQTIGR